MKARQTEQDVRISAGDKTMLYTHKPLNKFLRYDRFIDREATMLDLSFKQESLSITTPMGEIIQISLFDTTSDTAMLGIDAPSECIIVRESNPEH